VGSIIGDGIAQYTSRSTSSSSSSSSSSGSVGGRHQQAPAYDVGRAVRLCTYAAVIGSPIGHYWFTFLDKVHRRGVRALQSSVSEVAPGCCSLMACPATRPATRPAPRPNLQLRADDADASRTRPLQFIFPNAMGHPVTAVVKTLLDQLLMAPAGIGLFFTAMGVMEGASPSQVRCARARGAAAGSGASERQPRTQCMP
jgi:hypothetical protein